MTSASSSVCARIRAATSCSSSPRSTAGVRAHGPFASEAAAMAASTCSPEGSATVAIVSSVAGFSTSSGSPSPTTCSPLIRCLVSASATAAMLRLASFDRLRAMERRTGGDEWRVEVDLDDPEHGYTLSERLHALDLTPELEDRLGNRVIVTRDGPKVFVYTGSESQAAEAEKVVREILSEDELSGTVRVTRWHPSRRRGRTPPSPCPRPTSSVRPNTRRASRPRRRRRRSRASTTGRSGWTFPTWATPGSSPSACAVEGLDVTRRWRHIFVGAPTEEAAAGLAKRLESEAPEGSEVHVQPTDGIPHPLFVWLGAADLRGP